MEDLKDIIAKNLTELRTQAGLTQLQLAEMLNYSDKAVSKWERGEAIPDIRVLVRLSDIYGVSLDSLVKGGGAAVQTKPRRRISSNHAFISALSVGLVWFIATCLFVVFFTGIVLTVFSAKWGNRVTNALASSLILWACVLIFHIYVITFAPTFTQIYLLYIVAAVFEVLIILWFVYRWFASRKK